jgi:hypothetical protein
MTLPRLVPPCRFLARRIAGTVALVAASIAAASCGRSDPVKPTPVLTSETVAASIAAPTPPPPDDPAASAKPRHKVIRMPPYAPPE